MSSSVVTEQQRGYSAQFVVENSAHYPQHSGRPRRNRRTLVCIACHERKLRCDKKQPCRRCEASGMGGRCRYQSTPSPPAQKRPRTEPPARVEPSFPNPASLQPASAVQPAPEVQPAPGPSDVRLQVHGTTHWAEIASEFEEACPYLFGTDPRWEDQNRRLKRLTSLFPMLLAPNFPFGNLRYFVQTREQVLPLLPSKGILETLVDNYMNTYDRTYRLFHPPQFRDELDACLRDREAMSDGWYAQLCMVAAFGCQTATNRVFDGTGYYADCWAIVFLDAAEMFLGRSPYVAAPDLTAIRTLCLMVLVRHADIFKSASTAPLVTLMGVLRNLALTMNLHQPPSRLDGMSDFEAEMRRRLWATVRMLDVDVAMRTGTALVSLARDVDPPLNVDDDDYVRKNDGGWHLGCEPADPKTYTDGTFQIKLHKLLPLLEDTIMRANSPLPMSHDDNKMALLDGELRAGLREIQEAFTLPAAQDAARARKANMQRELLEVLVHRALLALHHTPSRARHGAPAAQVAASRARITDSSLALLQIHHEWAASMPARYSSIDTDSGTTRAGGWLLDVCHDDFVAAVMYIFNAERRRAVEGRSGGGGGGGGGGCGAPEVAPGRALALARRSAEIIAAMSCRSVAHHKEFVTVSIMLACVECVAAGERDMYPKLTGLAEWLETSVTSERKIWAGKYPKQADLLPVPPDP